MPPDARQNFELSPAQVGSLAADTERRGFVLGLWELTKPRLSFLSVTTALVGYLTAQPQRDFWLLFHFLCGTALAAGGAAALNQWMERRTDALMRRTKDRPIPSGTVTSRQAFGWGVFLSVTGVLQVLWGANAVAALLAAATVVSYLMIYTPSKRRTRWSTEIGAVSGALPPLIGWAAARGTIDGLGWVLFAVLFFWQIPHFLAIAWIYRRDYAAADFPMLPVLDADGRATGLWATLHTALLTVATLAPLAFGYSGWWYGVTALVLGAVFLVFVAQLLLARDREPAARRVFFYSIVYLPALLAVLVLDRWTP
jgi:protoheme IX farnesyltransferase